MWVFFPLPTRTSFQRGPSWSASPFFSVNTLCLYTEGSAWVQSQDTWFSCNHNPMICQITKDYFHYFITFCWFLQFNDLKAKLRTVKVLILSDQHSDKWNKVQTPPFNLIVMSNHRQISCIMLFYWLMFGRHNKRLSEYHRDSFVKGVHVLPHVEGGLMN